jgi:hypothetical protein
LKQLSRFLRLERVRKDTEHEVPAALSRFATLEEERSNATVPARCAAGLERFSLEPAELELERPDTSEPFIRCPRCGADSVRHAAVCRQCEGRLDSDEVRDFNLRLWAAMSAARERETQELREREVLRRGQAVDEVSEEATAEALASGEHARRALQAPRLRAPVGQAPGGASRAWALLAALGLGVPLLFVFARWGASGAAFLVVVGILAVLAAWRWR